MDDNIRCRDWDHHWEQVGEETLECVVCGAVAEIDTEDDE